MLKKLAVTSSLVSSAETPVKTILPEVEEAVEAAEAAEAAEVAEVATVTPPKLLQEMTRGH